MGFGFSFLSSVYFLYPSAAWSPGAVLEFATFRAYRGRGARGPGLG